MLSQKQIERNLKSQQGSKDSYQKRINNYNLNPKKCKQCNGNLPYNKRQNKFCGHTCSAIFNNRGVRRHGNPKNKICDNCGNPILNKGKFFCSMNCCLEFKRKKYEEDLILNGKFKDAFKADRPKQYLIGKYGHKCMICGIEKWREQPVPLVFDHIDGNSDNWNVENCRIVCRNCDGQLDTFAGKNVGKGGKRVKKWLEYKKNKIDK